VGPEQSVSGWAPSFPYGSFVPHYFPLYLFVYTLLFTHTKRLKHLSIMLLFQDIITGDEMVSDSFDP
jgi:hypothetical protein